MEDALVPVLIGICVGGLILSNLSSLPIVDFETGEISNQLPEAPEKTPQLKGKKGAKADAQKESKSENKDYSDILDLLKKA